MPTNETPPRLSNDQFEALAKISRLRPGSDKYAALFQVLVNGASISDARQLTGCKYSNVWDAVEAAKININLCKSVAYLPKRV